MKGLNEGTKALANKYGAVAKIAKEEFAKVSKDGKSNDETMYKLGFLSGYLNKENEYEEVKTYTYNELRFHCSRFAHLCRLKDAVTNDETLSIFDEEYKEKLNY
jgi:hypothetical protein